MSSSNFPELKPRIYDWNIDDEQSLINKIQSFTNDYTDQCNAVANNLTNFSHNLDVVEIDLYNSLNSLKTISLHKFIEHIVDNDEPIQKQEEEQVEPPLLTAEERNNLQIQLVQNTIKLSIDAIPVKEPRQQHQQEENQDDDSVSVASSRLLTNQVALFKNLKLPYIIGTKNFMITEYVGLVPEEIKDDNVIEGVENTMQQVKEGNENEREFVPIDNGLQNNDQQYQQQYQNQYQQPQGQMQYQQQQQNQQPSQQQYQQPSQQQYQQPPQQPQPQLQPQPKMKGSIPVPPPMNIKIPKGGNINNAPMQNDAVYQQNISMGNSKIDQQQMQQPQENQGYQNNQPMQKQKEPEDVRTLLMRQMKERANPKPQIPLEEVQENPGNNYVNNSVQANNPLTQNRTLGPQTENRQFRTGTMVGGKKEIRLGDFVKKSMFDDEDDDGDDDDFDPHLFKHSSRTIVDKNRFKAPSQISMSYSQAHPQMMQQPMLQQPTQQQPTQQQPMLQQPTQQLSTQQKLLVRQPPKKNNLFEDDNNDVENVNVRASMKSKLDTTNTKKLGEKLLKFFDDDEDEEDNDNNNNIHVEKIEEKTKSLAEKLKQMNEEDEKIKVIPKKEESKPIKAIKKPTFFDDDDDNDEEKPIQKTVSVESKPTPIQKATTIENKPKQASKIENLPKKKGTFNLFENPLQGKPFSSEIKKEEPKTENIQQPVQKKKEEPQKPKKKGTFNLFEDPLQENNASSDPKKEEPKPQNIRQEESQKPKKKGSLFLFEDIPQVKPISSEVKKEEPKQQPIHQPIQKKKEEPQKQKKKILLFGDDDEEQFPVAENKKHDQQNPSQEKIKTKQILKIEEPKTQNEAPQKKEIIDEKTESKKEVFIQPVEQKKIPQKQEPQKKLNPFEKMLAQKKVQEQEQEKQREKVQIKKADFSSRFSDIQNVS